MATPEYYYIKYLATFVPIANSIDLNRFKLILKITTTTTSKQALSQWVESFILLRIEFTLNFTSIFSYF